VRLGGLVDVDADTSQAAPGDGTGNPADAVPRDSAANAAEDRTFQDVLFRYPDAEDARRRRSGH
jgi:hypothetical protein